MKVHGDGELEPNFGNELTADDSKITSFSKESENTQKLYIVY